MNCRKESCYENANKYIPVAICIICILTIDLQLRV